MREQHERSHCSIMMWNTAPYHWDSEPNGMATGNSSDYFENRKFMVQLNTLLLFYTHSHSTLSHYHICHIFMSDLIILTFASMYYQPEPNIYTFYSLAFIPSHLHIYTFTSIHSHVYSFFLFSIFTFIQFFFVQHYPILSFSLHQIIIDQV